MIRRQSLHAVAVGIWELIGLLIGMIDLPEPFRRCLFLDVEASGLHASSFPIEVGWCDLQLTAGSFLIRPVQAWGEEGWSYVSERIHGIPYQLLLTGGLDIVEASHRLNEICRGHEELSDNLDHDTAWVGKLFCAAGTEQEFSIGDAQQVMSHAARLSGLNEDEAQEIRIRIETYFPHPHRAAPDARRCAALFLAFANPDLIDDLIASA